MAERRILLIRHAESVANAGKPTSNPKTIPLSSKGVIQAEGILNNFFIPNRIRPKRIVYTDHDRTEQTAKPTKEYFTNPQNFPDANQVIVERWDNIGEFSYLGQFENSLVPTNLEERRPAVEAYWDRSEPEHSEGGGQTFNSFVQRGIDFVDKLKHVEEDIAVFGHGIFMNMVHWILQERIETIDQITSDLMKEFKQFAGRNPVENASVHEIDLEEGTWTTIYTPPQIAN